MGVTLTQGPDIEGLRHITTNMRSRDKDEIYATRWDDCPDFLAEQAAGSGGFQWLARVGEEPAAAIGATPLWPNVWSVWAFGTKSWPRCVLSLTKHVKRVMIPALHQAGAHRAECRALKTHTEACRWLEMLGARKEAELAGFGRQREDFNLYVWRQSDVFLRQQTQNR